MSDFLGIDIKTLDDGGFQFYQTGLTQKVLEATGMDHYNGFQQPPRLRHLLGQMRIVLSLRYIGPTHMIIL